jgi:LuxR family transcriptional regulator, maltose regulon positive regulatory protein
VALVARVRLYPAEGRIVEAKVCLNRLERIEAEYPAPTQCAWSDILTHRSLAQAFLFLTENRLRDAIAILRVLRQEAEASRNHYRAVRLPTVLSEALLDSDEREEAEQVFSEVLRTAAAAGLSVCGGAIVGHGAAA